MWSCFKSQKDIKQKAYEMADARLSWEQRARWEERITHLEKESEKTRQYLNHLGGKLSRHEGATLPLLKETETKITFLNSKPCYNHLLAEYKEMSRAILRKAFDINIPRGEPEDPSKERGESCHAAINFGCSVSHGSLLPRSSSSTTSIPSEKKFRRLEPTFSE